MISGREILIKSDNLRFLHDKSDGFREWNDSIDLINKYKSHRVIIKV